MKNAYLITLGLIAGFCSAALGIGGGAILVPASVLILHINIKKALGTSLATAVPTALTGIITHYIIDPSNIKFLIALFVIFGSIVGAGLGAKLAHRIIARKLKISFALLLMFVGLKLTGIIKIPTEPILAGTIDPLLVVLGVITGIASALFGIGGGILMVPAFHLFFGLSIHEAIATSLTVILPTTLCGAIFHKRLNNINIEPLKFLIPAALFGAILGAVTANNMPANILRIIFGILMIIFCIRLFMQKGDNQDS